jgi:dodecin
MPDSVYRVTDVIGTSSESLESGAPQRGRHCRRRRAGLAHREVVRQDVTVENGAVTGYGVFNRNDDAIFAETPGDHRPGHTVPSPERPATPFL